MSQNNLPDLINKLLLRRLSNKKVYGLFQCRTTCINDKDTDQDTKPAIQDQSCIFTDHGCDQNQCRRNSIAQTVH